MIQSCYVQSKFDYSLYTKFNGAASTIILVYVDDLVLWGTDIDEITHIKTLLNDKFSIKDIRELKYFIGFEVSRSKEGIVLYQRKYVLDLLQDTWLSGAKPCNTPMQPHLHLHKEFGISLSDPIAYRRLIGRLPYQTHSRLEIS